MVWSYAYASGGTRSSKAVSADLAVDVHLSVIDDAVNVFTLKTEVGSEFVGVDVRI